VGYALEGEFDVSAVHSNEIAIEWPPRSGRTESFPEVDRAAWFSLSLARRKIIAGQLPFLDRLEVLCNRRSRPQWAGPSKRPSIDCRPRVPDPRDIVDLDQFELLIPA